MAVGFHADDVHRISKFIHFWSQFWGLSGFADGPAVEAFDQDDMNSYPKTRDFWYFLQRTVFDNRGRRLMFTAGGMMGAVASLPQPSDSIVLFAGSSVPSMLREQDGYFVYLGPANLYGATNDKLWTDVEDRFKTFVLIGAATGASCCASLTRSHVQLKTMESFLEHFMPDL